MSEPHWINEHSVLAIHDFLIELNGGGKGVRDRGMLLSAIDRPKNKFHYGDPTIFELAAAYAYGISMNHPFIDGNKRSAFMTMALVLEKNGYQLVASESAAIQYMLELAAGQLTEEALSEWIKANATEVVP